MRKSLHVAWPPPLEEAINGVENMTYMTSNSSNDGSMSLTVFFKQGTNADIAAVNVQNRVSKATSQIPAEVIQAGISTQKQQNSIIMFIGLYSTDTSYDETFLQNYAKINLIPKIQRIPGGRGRPALWYQGLFHAHLAETRPAGGQ